MWRRWLMGLVFLAGCHSFAERQAPVSPARTLWVQGQLAMRRGASEQAINLYQQSLEHDGSLTQNHLSLAAAYLADGEHQPACEQLEKFLDAHPEHAPARLYHAELLLRLGRLA